MSALGQRYAESTFSMAEWLLIGVLLLNRVLFVLLFVPSQLLSWSPWSGQVKPLVRHSGACGILLTRRLNTRTRTSTNDSAPHLDLCCIHDTIFVLKPYLNNQYSFIGYVLVFLFTRGTTCTGQICDAPWWIQIFPLAFHPTIRLFSCEQIASFSKPLYPRNQPPQQCILLERVDDP